MYRRSDPRFRRTLNEISQTIESANESAQANVYSFSHNYVSPCLDSLTGCLNACTAPCFPGRDQRRRSRARSRGRAELSFDFYDDWEDDAGDDGLLGWSNDEYDGLLAGQRAYGTTAAQPGRQRAMSYGARRGNRRKSQVRDEDDPTIIPASSYWGFLGKLTGKIGGGKNLRYKPSAADLQDHPGAARHVAEGEPLLEEQEDDGPRVSPRKRARSDTQGSGNTTDSLSSRGDIFPSEDELDDAIPLDDEFAMVLERRTTNSGADEASSGSARKGKRPSAGSRLSTRTMSSKSSRNSKHSSRGYNSDSHAMLSAADEEPKIIPSMAELRHEEETVQKAEEAEVAHKREAARRLATEQGLVNPAQDEAASASLSTQKQSSNLTALQPPTTEKQSPPPPSGDEEASRERPASEGTTPFPVFDPSSTREYFRPASSAADQSPQPDVEGDEFNPAQLPRLGSMDGSTDR